MGLNPGDDKVLELLEELVMHASVCAGGDRVRLKQYSKVLKAAGLIVEDVANYNLTSLETKTHLSKALTLAKAQLMGHGVMGRLRPE